MNNQELIRLNNNFYTEEDLLNMEAVALGAMFRERVHHGIEVKFAQILARDVKVPQNFGRDARLILKIWQQRGLNEDTPDIKWGKKYLEFADRLIKGEKINPAEIPATHQPFNQEQLETIEDLLRERRSIREWQQKEIPQNLIEKILEAGRMAPLGCNLCVVRFMVLRTPEEINAIISDVPTPPDRCVIIVIGYDTRVYPIIGHDKSVPHNQMLDCGAAGDHMLLMAHALGLGGVWLSQSTKTAQKFKEKIGAPDYFQSVMHIAVGWPATGTIKTKRIPLADMIIETNLTD